MLPTRSVVKYFSKVIAFAVLAAFGATFVALDSHGTSACTVSVSTHQSHFAKTSESSAKQHGISSESKSESRKSKSGEGRDCHCSHASNCVVIMPSQNTVELYFAGRVGHALSQDHFYSTFIDGLIKPPRA